MNLQVVRERAIESAAPPRVDRDHDLLQALRRREPMAAEGLVTRYGERAYRLASRITGNVSDAEEVVQDAFWTVVRKIETFRGDSAFGSWLYRIVANAAYQKLRGRPSGRRELSLDDVLPLFDESGRHAAPVADWSPRVEDPAMQVELRTALSAAIEELPASYRAVLVLRDVEGRSNGEIADVLGLNTAVVKTRVHRARLFLRKRLAEFATTVGADALAACAS
ncbi:MAG TPA: sigma-70 family RNA polymerase sigma factor [Methylomirabilota bacterium]|nr:sigma-70 family RNA polymerase sigma factor [Methylomirabilota bacterium]